MSTLRTRMLVASAGLALTSVVAVSCLSWNSARLEIVKTRQERLSLLAASFAHNIGTAFRQAETDLRTLAGDTAVAGSADGLVEGFRSSTAERRLILDSFTGSAAPEDRITTDTTEAASLYGRRHLSAHAAVRRLLLQKPYADVLLIDRAGRIVYTARKASDFGASLGDPDLAATALVRLFTKLEDTASNKVEFEDFAPYPYGGPSGFLGIPIQRHENVAMGTSQSTIRVGYLVLRLTSALVENALQPRTGFGHTGEVSVLGADGARRNDGPTPADRSAAAITATMAATVHGRSWTVAVRQDEAEALSATQDLVANLILSGILVGVLAMGVAAWATLSLIRPLRALTRALQKLGRREPLPQIPGSDRRDEIGEIARAVVAIQDVTAQSAQAEAELYRKLSEANHRLANLDPLTKLANRRGYFGRLTQAETAGGSGTPVVAMLLDLDGFKPINDTYGHAAGDEVLVEVARRMREAFGPQVLLARLGGDEFSVLMEGVTEADASRAAAAAIAGVSERMIVAGTSVSVGVSVGIAAGTKGDCRFADLIEKADIALYAAKAAGKGISVLYAPTLHASTRRHFTGCRGDTLTAFMDRTGVAA